MYVGERKRHCRRLPELALQSHHILKEENMERLTLSSHPALIYHLFLFMRSHRTHTKQDRL